MGLGPLEWFLLFATALQAVVALRLVIERVPWMRVAGVLFGLNAALTPMAVLELPAESPERLAITLLDGPTGALLLALAFLLPVPSRAAPKVVSFAAIWMALLAALHLAGFLPSDPFRALYQGLPLVAGYAAFLVRVVAPFARDPTPLGAHGAWIVGGFSVRVAELPVRFLTFSPWSIDGWLSLQTAGMWLLIVLMALVGAALLRRVPTAGEVRHELALVGAMMAVGVLLGLSGSRAQGLSANFLHALSLVLVRPVFAVLGAFGPQVALRLLGPLAAAGAGASLSIAAIEELAPNPSPAAVGIAAAGFAFLAAVSTSYWLARRKDRHGARAGTATEEAIDAALGGTARAPSHAGDGPDLGRAERWKSLVVFLARDETPEHSESRTRGALARHLRVETRNVHRIVEDANAAGGRMAGGPLVTWTLQRGRSNQMKFFYTLTPEGKRLAEMVAAQGPL